MKLRCAENSIRLRLRKSEVEQLAKHKVVNVSIGFPAGSFLKYELRIVPDAEIDVFFESGLISLCIPDSIAMQWINSEEVSISSEITLPDQNVLSLLIEKDFPCKNRPDEDKTDTFQELVTEEEKEDAC